MALQDDEHLAAILSQLQYGDNPTIDAPNAVRIAARRRRVLLYTYGSGINESTIAALENVDQSTISRDLTWWRKRFGKALSPDQLVGDLEARFDAIYRGAMQDVVSVDKSSPTQYRDRARLRMVAIAATVGLARLREGTGRIGPMPGGDAPGRLPSAASDVRRLAEEVRRLTGQQIEDVSTLDLVADGERAYLEGETVATTLGEDAEGPDREVSD